MGGTTSNIPWPSCRWPRTAHDTRQAHRIWCRPTPSCGRTAAVLGGCHLADRRRKTRGEMSGAQERQLASLLKKGARAHGWLDDLWTAARVTEVIRRHLEIEYHVEHVRHILKDRLCWSSQRPEHRSRERDEREIRRWTREELPRIKKSTETRRASCLS